MSKFFTVDGTPKREKQKKVMNECYEGKRKVENIPRYISCMEGGEIMSSLNQ